MKQTLKYVAEINDLRSITYDATGKGNKATCCDPFGLP